MSETDLSLAAAPRHRPVPRRRRPIVSILMQDHGLAPADAMTALSEAHRSGAEVSRALISEELARPEVILAAQSARHDVTVLDPARTPPDPALAGLLPPEVCLRHAVLPWRRSGGTLTVATARPERFEDLAALLRDETDRIEMALIPEALLHEIIADRHGDEMARRAETQVPTHESCRDMGSGAPLRLGMGTLCALACLAGLVLAPTLFFALATVVAIATLLFAQLMKVAALVASHTGRRAQSAVHGTRATVSLLIPLFREEDIAGDLLRRLKRLDYPRAGLDILLILETGDKTTRRALAGLTLPPFVRVIEVPAGPITTKPRALNYALRFARGEIIGIYDAEDAPAPDQLRRVVGHFARSPPEMACLQGILDFYNPHANWLSRCFTIEYATWFRVVLPGLARLGFAIPLGGTTVFFRREALEAVGGWDAHNVTEDADLGVRLARHGYRTELLPIVTREEANNRLWPWIRQRSRWLKGYMITWRVHMRAPWRLRRELGNWKTFGIQLVFLTAFLQFLLAPALWSFWLVLAGWSHPFGALFGTTALRALLWTFLATEGVSLLVSIAAISRSPHTGLLPWAPTLFLYFPLGAIAAYKAAFELVSKPFYWDKTAHGHSAPDHAGADLPEDRPEKRT